MVVEKVFAVIAESTRRDLLEALAQESKSVGQLVDELGVSQPTVSKHLRVLREAGVVTMRAQGQKRYYGINTEPLALVSTWLESLGAGVVDTVVAQRNGAARADSNGAARTDGAGAVRTDGAAAASSSEAIAGEFDAAAAAPVTSRPVVPAVAAVAAAPVAPMQNIPASAAAVESAPTTQPVAEKISLAAAATHQTEPSPASQAKTVHAPAASAAETHSPATPNGTAAVVPFGSVQSGVVQTNENDAGNLGQFSRSVGNAGRLANKAADLLSNLPALPTFKRRKS